MLPAFRASLLRSSLTQHQGLESHRTQCIGRKIANRDRKSLVKSKKFEKGPKIKKGYSAEPHALSGKGGGDGRFRRRSSLGTSKNERTW